MKKVSYSALSCFNHFTPKVKKYGLSLLYCTFCSIEKCISKVVRIGNMIIFHLSYEKPSSTYCVRLQGKFDIDYS